MNKFSKTSHARLSTCHKDLQKLFNTVLQRFDCSVLEGHRSKELQNRYFDEGKSKVRYPNGKHNTIPSRAVDVAPYPIDWEDVARFHTFAECVLLTAEELGIEIRWGGDWDMDGDTEDQSFNDLVHFELV